MSQVSELLLLMGCQELGCLACETDPSHRARFPTPSNKKNAKTESKTNGTRFECPRLHGGVSLSEIQSSAVVKQLRGPVDVNRCAGCRAIVPAHDIVEHQLTCPAWAGDGEPDWGCKDCLLVWNGPRGNKCPRCHGVGLVGFWS